MSVTLGIDVGTSGTKTIAIDETGAILAGASAEYPCAHPRPGWSEQDPGLWWDATKATIREVLAKGKLKPADVAGVGLSGQMHGSVFLDADGAVIRPALLWNDQRTGAECAEIEAKAGGREALIRLVANPALTGFTAPKLLWLRRHEPAAWDRVRQVLLPKDYVRYRLTGEYATEVSDASGTLLLDVANRRWSKELLGKLDLDAALLPPCYESFEVSGKLSKLGAEATGLLEGTPVVGGGGDQPAGAVGNGIVRPGGGLGHDGDLGRRLRPHRSARLRPAGPPPARLPRGARGLARHGGRPGGGRQLPVVPQPARGGRGGAGEGPGGRPVFPPDRRGRHRRPGGRGADLPALPDRRTDPALRPRRPGGLDRPDRSPRPGSHGPQPAGRGDLCHARQPGIDPRDGRSHHRDSPFRRRGQERALAPDPGRHLRPRLPDRQRHRGARLRRRAAGPGRHRRLLVRPRGLRRHHPHRRQHPRRSARHGPLRPRICGLPGPLPRPPPHLPRPGGAGGGG